MRIDVIGYGLCTGLGNTVAENWQAVLDGRVNQRPITRFPAEDFPQTQGGMLSEEVEDALMAKHNQDGPAMAMILEAASEALTNASDESIW